MLALAVGASVASCIVGIYASYYLDASTGGCIVAVQAALFFAVLILAPRRGLVFRARQRRLVRRASARLGTLSEA